MGNNKQIGDLGEGLAAKFLRRHGYRIIVRKYRSRFGEIDIVAQDKHVLVFVEVRSRSDFQHGFPFETVNFNKRRRIENVALEFQKRFNLIERESRFDCVSILFDKELKVEQIELIKDAFWRQRC